MIRWKSLNRLPACSSGTQSPALRSLTSSRYVVSDCVSLSSLSLSRPAPWTKFNILSYYITQAVNRRGDAIVTLARIRCLLSEGGGYSAMVMNLQPLPSSRYLAHAMPSSVSDASLSTTAADEEADEDDILLPNGASLASLAMPLVGPYGGICDENTHGTPKSTSSYMLLDASLHSTTSGTPRAGARLTVARGRMDDSSPSTSTLYHTDSSGCISSAVEGPEVIPQQTSQRLPPCGTEGGDWPMDTTTEEDWPTWSEGVPSTATSSSTSDKQMMMVKSPLSPGGGGFATGGHVQYSASCGTSHSMMIDIPVATATTAATCASSHHEEGEMFHLFEDIF